MLLLGSIRSIMIICIRIDNVFFLKSSRPSLPLKKAPPFSPSLSSIVFTTPSVPLLGDRNPQGREDETALRCSEPLRYKVGGASKPCAILCGMGPPYYSLLWDRRAVARDGLKIYDQSPRHVLRDGTAWLSLAVTFLKLVYYWHLMKQYITLQ